MNDGEVSGCETILRFRKYGKFSRYLLRPAALKNRVIFNLPQAPFLEPRSDFLASVTVV